MTTEIRVHDGRAALRENAAVRGLRSGRAVGSIVLRRVVQIPIVLLIVSILVFWLVQVVPGDPGRVALGQYATAEQVARWKTQNGLGGSLLSRYLDWLGGFVTGDWGTSLAYQQPASEIVVDRLGHSLALGLYAFVITTPIALALGFFQARRAGRRSDRAITMTLISLSSTPEFTVGVVLLVLFSVTVPMFPVQSQIPDGASFNEVLTVMTLPAVTIAIASLGYVTRMVRAGTIETLRSHYHRTAVLKGLPPGRILRAHVAKNSVVPATAVIGGQLAYMLGGTAVVETLFSYPGLGLLIVDSVQKKDLLVLESAVLVTAVVAIVILLITDLGYLALDPRVRLTKE